MLLITNAPQIDVPHDIRSEVFLSIFSNFPIFIPNISVKITKIKTYENSDTDNSEMEVIGYPKPIRTTEVFSKLLVNSSVLPSNGFLKIM